MKILKIVLVVFLILIIVAAVGTYLFLKTFDANKFLPQITQQATQAIGRDLKVGKAELGFSFAKGISLQVRDVVLADDRRFSDKPFLTLERADVGLDLGVLIFQRKIQMAQVTLVAPQVVIIRSKEGAINAATIGQTPQAVSSTTGSASQAKPVGALPALLVNDIKVVGAHVTYIDEMFTPRLAVQAGRIDVHVRDFSFSGPFAVTIKAALFSAEQDIIGDAQVTLDIARLSARIKPVNMELDLAKFDASRLENELPMLKEAGLKKLGGIFKLSFADMQVSAQGVSGLKGQAVLDKGMVVAALLPVPVEDIQLQADLDDKNIRVTSFSCAVSEGTVSGTALVADYLSDPGVGVTFDAKAINVKELAEGYKLPVGMSGLISSTGEMKFAGKSPEALMASLNGKVQGELKNGVLENINLLAAGLGNIPMLPGLLDTVMAVLPAETQEEIRKGITILGTCKAEVHMADGLVHLDGADLSTRDLAVHASGTVKLVQELSIKADIRMDKDLSRRLGEKVPELAYLKDEGDRIYLPMTVTGPLLKPAFMPDVEYLTKKLIVAAGGEELQKVLGGSPAAAEAVGAIFDLFKKK